MDLFAGPGGLGEGFSSFNPHVNRAGLNPFQIRISVEMDKVAHETLQLRAFYRNLARNEGDASFYYEIIRNEPGKVGEIGGLEDLVNSKGGSRERRAFAEAERETLCATLGSDDPRIPKGIREAIAGKRDWVLIGGPPCQAYSLVGRSRNRGKKDYRIEDDPRSHLYRQYLEVIADHSPSVFLMENVKGMLSARLNGERVFDKILRDLRRPKAALGRIGNQKDQDIHYEIVPAVKPEEGLYGIETTDEQDYIVRSERYGVPQNRHRVILLGVRSDIFAAKRSTKACDWFLKPQKGSDIWDAIGDLPPLASFLSALTGPDGSRIKAEGTRAELSAFMAGAYRYGYPGIAWKWLKGYSKKGPQERKISQLVQVMARRISRANADHGNAFIPWDSSLFPETDRLHEWLYDPLLGGVANHESRRHLDMDLVRYLFAACFARVKQRTPSLVDFPEELIPEHKSAGTGHFNDRFRVQCKSQPATTVTSHISKDGHYFIHPSPRQCRSLTVREAARIQTFKDNYFFCGKRTSQFHQVGNAVPPYLARQLAGAVWRILGGTI